MILMSKDEKYLVFKNKQHFNIQMFQNIHLIN
jgi:hypothetical protein